MTEEELNDIVTKYQGSLENRSFTLRERRLMVNAFEAGVIEALLKVGLRQP